MDRCRHHNSTRLTGAHVQCLPSTSSFMTDDLRSIPLHVLREEVRRRERESDRNDDFWVWSGSLNEDPARAEMMLRQWPKEMLAAFTRGLSGCHDQQLTTTHAEDDVLQYLNVQQARLLRSLWSPSTWVNRAVLWHDFAVAIGVSLSVPLIGGVPIEQDTHEDFISFIRDEQMPRIAMGRGVPEWVWTKRPTHHHLRGKLLTQSSMVEFEAQVVDTVEKKVLMTYMSHSEHEVHSAVTVNPSGSSWWTFTYINGALTDAQNLGPSHEEVMLDGLSICDRLDLLASRPVPSLSQTT